MLKKVFKKTRAFTLIELTIATTIVAGAGGTYRGVMNVVNRSVCQQHLRQAAQLLMMYEMNHGHLPDADFYPKDPLRDPRSIIRIIPELQPLLVCRSMPDSLARRGLTFIWNDACSGKSITRIKNARSTWLLMAVSAVSEEAPAPHLGGFNVVYADCQTIKWVKDIPELTPADAPAREFPKKVPEKTPRKEPLMKSRDFEILSPEFEKILKPESKVVSLGRGMKFTEGPVWVAEGGHLLFSDIRANRIIQWKPRVGTKTWRTPSDAANGNTLDRQGRLVTCEHRSRRLSRTEKDGKVVTLADRYLGKRLNSPNDVVVKSDGTIWFTDPPYGIKPSEKELPANYVFRLDPNSKDLTVVASDFERPNGLCFSPDEKRLYIADSSLKSHIRVFDVTPDNKLTGGKVFAKLVGGAPDGMRVDTEGRLYVAGGPGILVYDPSGTLLGTIRIAPERPSNCSFGGKDGHTLFITARSSLYSVKLASTGAQKP